MYINFGWSCFCNDSLSVVSRGWYKTRGFVYFNLDPVNSNICYIFQDNIEEGLIMDDSLIFITGLFCFVMAIIGAVLTVREFKNIENQK